MEKNYEAREWSVRHIPVRVKGRSPRPYRIPKLWVSIMLGVCLYLAVHLNSHSSQQVLTRHFTFCILILLRLSFVKLSTFSEKT